MIDTTSAALTDIVTKGLLDKTLSVQSALIIAAMAIIAIMRRWGGLLFNLFKGFKKKSNTGYRSQDVSAPTRINGHPCSQHEALTKAVALLTTQSDIHHQEQKAEILSIRSLVEKSFLEINKKTSEQSVVLGQHGTAIDYISKSVDNLVRRN